MLPWVLERRLFVSQSLGGSVYRKGDTVVHPEHGAAVIEDLRERDFLGEKKKYFVLRLAY